jgi:hypothetical protein
MKSVLAVLFVFISLSVEATTNDLECVASITNPQITRPAFFHYNEENNSYEAYRATLETGGVSFYAKIIGTKVQMVMSREFMDRMEILASKMVEKSEDMSLSVSLEAGHTASMSCFKND